MATHVMSKALMASEDVQSYVGTCRFGDSLVEGADTSARKELEIFDGALVNIGSLISDPVYGGYVGGAMDWNVHQAIFAADPEASREEICIVDLADLPRAYVDGVQVYLGQKLVNLVLPAGENARFRRLQKGDKYWIGEGNFADGTDFGLLQIGTTCIAEADTGKYEIGTPEDGAFAVKALAYKSLQVGRTGIASTTPAGHELLWLVEVQ